MKRERKEEGSNEGIRIIVELKTFLFCGLSRSEDHEKGSFGKKKICQLSLSLCFSSFPLPLFLFSLYFLPSGKERKRKKEKERRERLWTQLECFLGSVNFLSTNFFPQESNKWTAGNNLFQSYFHDIHFLSLFFLSLFSFLLSLPT